MESVQLAGPVAVIRGIARILEKGCNHRLQRAQSALFLAAQRRNLVDLEVTPLINDVIINLSAKLGVVERLFA